MNNVVEINDDSRIIFLKNKLKENSLIFYPIQNECLEDIYLLFHNLNENNINNDLKLKNSNYQLYLGRFYQMNKNIDKMIFYYTCAEKNHNTTAMILLGNYFEKKDDISIFSKYYLNASKYGDLNGNNALNAYLSKTISNGNRIELFIILLIISIFSIGLYFTITLKK